MSNHEIDMFNFNIRYIICETDWRASSSSSTRVWERERITIFYIWFFICCHKNNKRRGKGKKKKNSIQLFPSKTHICKAAADTTATHTPVARVTIKTHTHSAAAGHRKILRIWHPDALQYRITHTRQSHPESETSYNARWSHRTIWCVFACTNTHTHTHAFRWANKIPPRCARIILCDVLFCSPNKTL